MLPKNDYNYYYMCSHDFPIRKEDLLPPDRKDPFFLEQENSSRPGTDVAARGSTSLKANVWY